MQQLVPAHEIGDALHRHDRLLGALIIGVLAGQHQVQRLLGQFDRLIWI